MAFIPIYDGPTRSATSAALGHLGVHRGQRRRLFLLRAAATCGEATELRSIYGFGLIPATCQRLLRSAGRPRTLPDWLTHRHLLPSSTATSGISLGNMVFLWVFADNVEDALGHVRFFIFYLLCAVGAGSGLRPVRPGVADARWSAPPGAVAGVVAAYLMLHPRAKVWVLPVRPHPAAPPRRLGARLLDAVPALLVLSPGDDDGSPGGRISAGSSPARVLVLVHAPARRAAVRPGRAEHRASRRGARHRLTDARPPIGPPPVPGRRGRAA